MTLAELSALLTGTSDPTAYQLLAMTVASWLLVIGVFYRGVHHLLWRRDHVGAALLILSAVCLAVVAVNAETQRIGFPQALFCLSMSGYLIRSNIMDIRGARRRNRRADDRRQP